MIDTTLFERHSEYFSPTLGLYFCGKRVKTPNHVYGPEIRSYFLIVYVEDGDAILYTKNKRTQFGKGQLLVMFPGEKIFYKAQTDWSIRWIGINGKDVEDLFTLLGVSPKQPIWTVPKAINMVDYMEKIYQLQEENLISNKYKTQALLCELFANMLKTVKNEIPTNNVDEIIFTAKNIIAYNYNNNIEITSIAQKVFLAPAYFSRLFKEKTGISPKQYITKVRLEKAKELLRTPAYSIKNIAITVGFKDALYFSKLFTKHEGLSPLKYRKNHIISSQ